MPKRTDDNQARIVAILRKLGASVVSLHTIGKGCPDLAVAIAGKTYLVEIKDGRKKWKMTPDQAEFHETWKAPIAVLDSESSAILWVQRNRQK